MVVRGGGQLDTAVDKNKKTDQNRRQQILQKCSDITVEYFQQFLSPAAEAVIDHLFHNADQAESTQQQNELLNQRDQMQKLRSRFSELLAEQLSRNFNALIQERPVEETEQEPANLSGRSELKLIDDEDLEEKLIMLGMISKVELRHAPAIYSLNERFSVLNHGGKRIKDDNNPCGPLKLGDAIQRAMNLIEDESFPKAELFKELDLVIQEEIATCYEDINNYLIEEDILPNLQPSSLPYKANRSAREEEELNPVEHELDEQDVQSRAQSQGSQTVPQRRSTDPGSAMGASAPHPPGMGIPLQDHIQGGGSSTGQPRQVPNDSGRNRNLISNIREMISKRYQQQASSPQITNVPQAKLQNALSNLQSSMATQDVENRQPSISELKASLGKLLSKDGKKGDSYSLSESHTQTFDIFEMLYDFVEQETVLHKKVENLLSQLQVPLLRVALQDEDFFNDSHHPARKLFNTIAEAGELWMGDTVEDSKTFGKMQTATTHVLNEFNDDVDVFRDLIGDLDGHIKLLNRKAQISEKRQVETLQGQERLELARQQAQQVVDQLIEKHNPPLFIKSVLQKPWADYLGLILLRHGNKSEIWNTAIGVANMLIISVQEELHPSVKSSINNRKDWLYTELKRGLGQVGYYENDITDVMTNLQACHRWSLAEIKEPESTAPAEQLPEEIEKAETAKGEVADAIDVQTASEITQSPDEVTEQTSDLSEQALNEAFAETADLTEETKEKFTTPDPTVVYERFEPDPIEKPELLDSEDLLPKALKVKPRTIEPILKTSHRPLTPDQTTMLNKLRKLEFGTWFEILFKDTTEWVKRKLAWYSPVTDRCMLVNNRGASCEQITMHDLAEYMAEQNARIFTPRKKPLMDRALESIFKHLKKLSTLTSD